jgi:hypothetical protein
MRSGESRPSHTGAGGAGPDAAPVAAAAAAVNRRLDREGALAAAARLDGLGVEVLRAVEALGLREAEVRLRYFAEVEDAGGAALVPFGRIAAPDAEAEAAGRVIRSVRCEAWAAERGGGGRRR